MKSIEDLRKAPKRLLDEVVCLNMKEQAVLASFWALEICERLGRVIELLEEQQARQEVDR